MTDNVLLGT